MQNNLRETYKVEKSNIEKSYEYQLGLKNNEEYKKRVDNTFITLARLFKKIYPNVKIESPRGREKSKKSLKNKIEKLEIERLCTLYSIEETTKEEKQSLYNLIQGKLNRDQKEIAEKIFSGEIENLKQIDNIMQEETEDHIKTALLRILNTNLKKENNQEMQKQLEEKYGETAARETKQLKNNLLHLENIENIDETEIKKLHSPSEYLKAKDLRGFKFVITDVPDDIQTNNENLKQLIQKRKQAPEEEKSRYNDLCCITLAEDFAKQLINNEEWLEKRNIQVLPGGYKHKEKQNGYIAEHIKFCYRDHPEYTFEMQLRSIYREDISRANGEAAHDKRAGKKRIFPSTANKESFIEELENTLPEYTIIESENSEFKLRKCTMIENMLEYFLGYVDFDNLDSKEYKKAIQYIQEEEQSQK